MPSRGQRSASQYQVKMHSTATTRSSRKGSTAFRNASGVERTFFVKEDRALPVEDAELHGLGVQIDAAVVSVGLRVESHGSSPERTGLVVRPAYSAWGRAQEGAWMRNRRLHLTGFAAGEEDVGRWGSRWHVLPGSPIPVGQLEKDLRIRTLAATLLYAKARRKWQRSGEGPHRERAHSRCRRAR